MDNKELTVLTQAVAESLGADWFVPEQEDCNWSRKIQHKVLNATLYVAGDGYNKPTKVNISGSMNVGEGNKYVEVYENVKRNDYTHWERVSAGSISVTIARGPEVIAKEIKRRLLPEYLRILALANAQVEKDRQYKATKLFNLERMAKAAGVTLLKPDKDYIDRRESFSIRYGELYGDVQAGEKDVEIKLHSLTLEQAEALLRFVKKL